ncbi:MAG: hypothetical protein ACOY93_13800 [Bacillota bacterium]
MATNRTAKYNALPQKLKDVDAALRELCEVITGGAFDPDKIWGESAEDSITDYMESLTTDPGLKTKINELLGGLPGSSAINSAIEAMTKGLQDVVKEIENTANELGDEVGTRYQAFVALNSPHATSPGYNYQPVDGKYGLFPAIAGVINEAAGSSFDTEAIMGPLNDIVNVAQAGAAIADFVAYASGCIDLLGEALTVTA